MARTFPEYFPYEANCCNPEYKVFQTLRTLPDRYSVFYSKKFKGVSQLKEEFEVDFLIFDGSRSLLCIEVKGGEIEYDGVQDAWYQNGKPLIKSPDRQASAATHGLIDYLGPLAGQLNIGWSLCFPDCSLPINSGSPSGVPRAIVIDEAGMLEPEKAIGLASVYYEKQYKRPGLGKVQADALVKLLTRSLGFVQKVGVRIARDRQQIVEVTNEQLHVLQDLMINSKMAVRGVAGSGKTLLAQELARRLEEDGRSVLLLFFNRMIANAVRYCFDRDSTINCTTFHGFARDRINANDPSWWADNKSSESDFWNIDVPLKLADCIESDTCTYDAIIIDEGQDFKRTWFEILEQYSPDRFVVFYDDAQNIFGHWNDLPWGANLVPRKILSRNCRNTRSIVSHLGSCVGTELDAFESSPIGEEVISKTFHDTDSQKNELVMELSRLLKEGVEPNQIIIIIDDKRPNTALAHLDRIGKVPIEDIGRTYHQRSKAIRFTNTKLFKGLEADVVFFLRTRTTEQNGVERYVACSRATTLLFDYEIDSAQKI